MYWVLLNASTREAGNKLRHLFSSFIQHLIRFPAEGFVGLELAYVDASNHKVDPPSEWVVSELKGAAKLSEYI